MEKLLQGRPFGHPLHPFLVHFPIALFTLSLLLDLLLLAMPGMYGVAEGAWYSMLAGVCMAFFAAIPGVADYTSIRKDHPTKKIATTHMILNLIVVVLYAGNLAYRYKEAINDAPTTFPLLLSIGAFILLTISGHLGGKMVFDDGISVGRHRRRTDLPKRTIGAVKDAPVDADGFIMVARDRDVDDGGTLRVNVKGTVMVIARSNGQLHAFQEFCTHRFGPLSEGCIHDHEIECPWHKSRFDMRSGSVTKGPAKEALKTFPVKVIDGMIAVAILDQPIRR
jgi:nitrite reductase/ring-hydroxylating ferredoxin subunit/uncharacterized membrane protein